MLLEKEISEDGFITKTLFDSSNVYQAIYLSNTNILYVFFKSGKVYSYEGVSQELFQNFCDDNSQGSFFAKNIKNNKYIYFRKEYTMMDFEIKEILEKQKSLKEI